MKNNKFLDKNSEIVIAVDGDAGSGKGTLCKKISKNFDLYYFQTSIFYRKLAKVISGRNFSDIKKIEEFVKNLGGFENISEEGIYSPEVSKKASEIAAIAKVREFLIKPQQEEIKKHKRIIIEGRDISTVIAPNADVKLYVTSDIEIRSERRYKQFQDKGENITLEEVRKDLLERDKRDKEREAAPLTIVEDAIILDSSNLDAEAFYKYAVEKIKSKLEEG